jgi:hypothetical protein
VPSLKDYPDWLKPEKDRSTEIWLGLALLFVTFAIAVVGFRLWAVLK